MRSYTRMNKAGLSSTSLLCDERPHTLWNALRTHPFHRHTLVHAKTPDQCAITIIIIESRVWKKIIRSAEFVATLNRLPVCNIMRQSIQWRSIRLRRSNANVECVLLDPQEARTMRPAPCVRASGSILFTSRLIWAPTLAVCAPRLVYLNGWPSGKTDHCKPVSARQRGP